MQYKPKGTIVIKAVGNGFLVEKSGTFEEQEDYLNNVLVFNKFTDLVEHMRTELKVDEGD